jgi:hypothetical protein
VISNAQDTKQHTQRNNAKQMCYMMLVAMGMPLHTQVNNVQQTQHTTLAALDIKQHTQHSNVT